MSISTTLFRHFAPFILILLSVHTFAQGIRGKVIDDTSNAVPGVAIYFKEIQSGGTTNIDGVYEMPLPEGVYTMSFQAMGYAKQEFRITVTDKWLKLDVMLAPVQFQLREVAVYSGEDPAYAIMRKAIGLTPHFRHQVKNYESEIYVKGSVTIHKIPRIIQINSGSIKEGETYTLESINRVRFAAPDTMEETVIAAQSSFPAEEDVNVMDYINLSLYDADNDLIISPLSPQALRHYKFRYIGFFNDGNYTVNRIEVIPRRKSQQLLKGDIYIVENLWCIHSVDLSVEAFFGKVAIRQLYGEVKDGVWLPVNHKIDVEAAIMRIKASFNYTGTVKYLSINTNDSKVAKPRTFTNTEADAKPQQPEPLTKNQKKIDNILTKEEMSNRDMVKLAALIEKENRPKREDVVLEIKNNHNFSINKDSIVRDSLFWNTIRPIPLTANEISGFSIRDSINAIAKAKTDTTKAKTVKKRSKFGSVVNAVWSGKNFTHKPSRTVFQYGGLFDVDEIDFNPVDGLKYAQNMGITWMRDTIHTTRLAINAGYAFSRKAFRGSATLSHSYLHLRRGYFTLTGSMGAHDYNTDPDIPRLLYMASMLLFKENLPRYYDDKRITAKNSIDLANGLQLNLSAAYQWAAPLANTTEFSFFYRNKNYNPNTVENSSAADAQCFDIQQAFIASVRLNYTPYQRYWMLRGRKIMRDSDFPTFTFGIEQGIRAFGSNANYLFVDAGAFRKPRDMAFSPVFSWSVNGGYYLINRQMHFSQYHHFNATRMPLLTQSFNDGFFLLNSYEASTNKWFVKATGAYSSPFIALKLLPFFSNRLWNENLHAGYLHTPHFPHYAQVGYSISRIFMVANVGVFAGFGNWKFQHWGVRVLLAAF
jgi:hypothetical protein